jgi:hypothetical protein
MPFHVELFWAGKEAVLNLSTMLAAVASNLWIPVDCCLGPRLMLAAAHGMVAEVVPHTQCVK